MCFGKTVGVDPDCGMCVVMYGKHSPVFVSWYFDSQCPQG